MSKLRKWMMKEERDTNSCGSGDLSSSAIKLFGKTIAVSASVDSASVCVSTKTGSDEVDGASTQLEGEDLGSSLGSICSEAGSKEGEVVNGDSALPEVVNASLVVAVGESALSRQPESNLTCSSTPQKEVHVPENGNNTPQRAMTQEEKKEQCSKKPDKLIPCPRCESIDTKFCYYNNYNINQPRHFCKSCQRYWTAGGTLRNVLVGAGRRKNKYGVGSKQDVEGNSPVVRIEHHEPAQQPAFAPAVMNAYALGTVPPMNLPHHGQSPRSNVVGSDTSTVSTLGVASAFKPLGSEASSDSVSKLRRRTQTDVTAKGDCASSGDTATAPTYVLTPRASPETQQAVWTKSSTGAPLGFFNGAWPYGYNIGWSGAGSMAPGPSSASVPLGSVAPSPMWTGMWASAAPVPTFGWNMLQGGWTLPWRPVPAVRVQMQQQQQQSPSHGVNTPAAAGVARKREGAAIAEGDRGKLARVGSGDEA